MNNQQLTATQQRHSSRFKPARVVVIGAGLVGSTFAYSLLLSGLAGEIVLVDANQARAAGEAMDLNHAMPFSHPTRIWAGSYDDCSGADVVVICAGVGQKPGESRLDLVRHNADVFGQIIPAIMKSGFDGVLLIATNPVDVLTYVSLKVSDLPASRVIGSGTILDTARFRFEISRHFGVDTRSVHANIIGEHGDSAQPVWSSAHIGGVKLGGLATAQEVPFDEATKNEIFARARDAAASIIQSKGATYYAIAAGLTCIVEAILRDQNTVLCVSGLVNDYEGIDDVCLSLPRVLNRNGAERILPLKLSPDELSGLHNSARILKTNIVSIETAMLGEKH